MKFKILTIFLLLSVALGGAEIEAISAEKLREIQKGIQQMRELLLQAPNLPPDEAIPRLGVAVEKTSHNRIYKFPERAELHEQLEQALIAIPGHAEYYRNKINLAQEKLDEAIERSKASGTNQTGNLKSLLRVEQNNGFAMLRELPSPETIRVLGEMLYDERGVIRKEKASEDTDAFLMQTPTSQLAASLLSEMIENPPGIDLPGTYFSDLTPWKNWYQQVKAGNRTYRFKGDPTEYDLNGIASAVKVLDVRRSDRRAIAGSSADAKREGEKSSAPAVTAIVLAVLIGGGYWVYRRKAVA